MKIGIIATHSWPIPTPVHTGDIVILDLARSLDQMGHEVTLVAPEGTAPLPTGRVLPMTLSSNGQATPTATECELAVLGRYGHELQKLDVVHDFSVTKAVAESMNRLGFPTVSTILGGAWSHPNPPKNICVWSYAQRDRLLRGATDYEDTATPLAGGPPVQPIKEARVVYGGVDTDFYCPDDYDKEDWFLYLNRWHPAKGYREAIELARRNPKVSVMMVGEAIEDLRWDAEKDYLRDAIARGAGLPNLEFRFLPKDPDHHTTKREYYRRAQALLYPVQFHEPFGLSMAEAMACGTPVYGFDLGSVGEVIAGSGGVSVIAGGVDALLMTVGWGGKEETFRDCRAKALERFDRFVMARNYVEQYRLAMAGGWG